MNKALIKQYVDTGLQITPNQFDSLPDWAKKTYLRKRIISANASDEVIAGYEYQGLSEDEQNEYVKNLSVKGAYKIISYSKNPKETILKFLNLKEGSLTSDDLNTLMLHFKREKDLYDKAYEILVKYFKPYDLDVDIVELFMDYYPNKKEMADKLLDVSNGYTDLFTIYYLLKYLTNEERIDVALKILETKEKHGVQLRNDEVLVILKQVPNPLFFASKIGMDKVKQALYSDYNELESFITLSHNEDEARELVDRLVPNRNK